MDLINIDIKHSNIPETTKYVLIIIIKGISWFPWVFFFIGLFLTEDIFFYWFLFFLVIEGSLVLGLIYILVLIVKASINENRIKDEVESDKKKVNSKADSILNRYLNRAKSGIIGNLAFYIVIILSLVVLKFMGIFDSFFREVIESIK